MEEFITNFHFSTNTWGVISPCVLMALDIVTGLLYAWISKTFNSGKMRSGLGKKVGELVIIMIGELFSYAAGLPKEIMNGILVYISFMELMSIFENLDKLDVPIPGFIKRVINNKMGETDDNLSD